MAQKEITNSKTYTPTIKNESNIKMQTCECFNGEKTICLNPKKTDNFCEECYDRYCKFRWDISVSKNIFEEKKCKCFNYPKAVCHNPKINKDYCETCNKNYLETKKIIDDRDDKIRKMFDEKSEVWAVLKDTNIEHHANKRSALISIIPRCLDKFWIWNSTKTSTIGKTVEEITTNELIEQFIKFIGYGERPSFKIIPLNPDEKVEDIIHKYY